MRIVPGQACLRSGADRRLPLLDMDESNQDSLPTSTEPLCITCGYDLRSLPTEESCPECGTAIALSLRGDLMSQSDPAWVARLARGQALLVLGLRFCLIAMVSAIVVPVLGFGLGFAFWFGLGINVPNWVFSIVFWSFGGALFIGVIVSTAGCALVTAQDPRDTLGESSVSNRNVARQALFALYGCVALGLASDFLPLMGTGSRILVGIVFLSIGVCLTVALVASLNWLATLATRIPNHDLRSRTLKSVRFFRWAIPVFILLFVISVGFPGPVAAGAALTASEILYSVRGCASLVIAAGILIASFRMYRDLRSYRNAFRKCAAEASASDSQPPVTD